MEQVLKLLADFFGVFEWGVFSYVLLKDSLIRVRKRYIFLFIIFTVISVELHMVLNFNLAIDYILPFIFIYMFFSKSLVQALKHYIFTFTMGGVLVSSVRCCVIAFLPNISENVLLICVEVIDTIALLVFYSLIGRKLNRDNFYLPKRVERLFIAILVVMLLMMSYFDFLLEEIPRLSMVRVGSVLILLGGIAICGMIMAAIYYFNGTERYRVETRMFEEYNEQQRQYFARLLEKEQRTKQFRHDIINHLMVLQGMAEKEIVSELQIYVKDLLADISGEQYQYYDVGNDVVNTILNYYLLPLKGKCDIQVSGYMLVKTVTSKDLCTLFSNLIKNAVEAVEKVDEVIRSVKVTINQGESFLNICVENTVEGNLRYDEKGLPKTSKKDKENHGFGLRNVQQIVEKYNGKHSFKEENGRFIANIYLKIDRWREDMTVGENGC